MYAYSLSDYLATKIVEALKPIEEVTKAISAESTSIGVVIPLVRMLEKTLEKHDNDSGIRTMKKEMLDSLHKRFQGIENDKYTAIATLVDPRFKDKFFYDSISRDNAKMMLKNEVEKESTSTTRVRLEVEPPLSKKQKTSDKTVIWEMLSEIIEESGASVSDDTESQEIERYLSEPLIDFHTSNCYTWWRDNTRRFPCLSSLARTYMCAPPTSVSSERLFSGAGLIYDDKRNRLAPEHAETLLMIKNNFCHYLDYIKKVD